jgi:hypothetical protein
MNPKPASMFALFRCLTHRMDAAQLIAQLHLPSHPLAITGILLLCALNLTDYTAFTPEITNAKSIRNDRRSTYGPAKSG